MDYQTAQRCADDMRANFTFNYYQPWEYGEYISNNKIVRGWHRLTNQYLPQLESTVAVEKNGNGDMYDVHVNARLTIEGYTLNGNAGYGSRPLEGALADVDGWLNADAGAWANGNAITAAGAENITLVTPPSYRDEWKLLAQEIKLLNGNPSNLSSLLYSTYYEVDTTYTAAVRYDGMTLQACRNLYAQLNNSSTGWELTSHPWVLSATQDGDGVWEITWTRDNSRTNYQQLNRATMQRTGGKMWSVELQLETRTQSIQRDGNTVTHVWPDLWQRIPGFSAYLSAEV